MGAESQVCIFVLCMVEINEEWYNDWEVAWEYWKSTWKMGKGKQTEEVQRKENAKLTVDEQRCSTVPRKAANVFQPLRADG